MKNRLIRGLIRAVVWRILLWWCATLRIRKTGDAAFERIRASRGRYVAAFWHGSMLLGWYVNRPGKGMHVSALVSQSKDGEYLSNLLAGWGFAMIRGSSHIGGKEAMQLMTDAVIGGNALCITPDGPRGPRHEMKMGAVRVAQKTEVPLFVIGIGVKNKKVLRSWDKFEIPMLFSTVNVMFSAPITVPGNLSGETLDHFKKDVEGQLNDLQQKAELFT